MQIDGIDVFQVDLPYAGGTYNLSGGRSYTSFDATFVRITTDTGIEGWGESTPFGSNYVAAHARGARAGIEELAPHMLGVDPRQVDRVNDRMDDILVGHPAVKTAIDVACWDAFGKAVDMPVCDLLGGSTGDRLPVISSVHLGDPDEMRARVAKHRALGYRGHSIKVGSLDAEGGPALDAERVAASMADAQPGEYFLVDANGGMTVEQALRFLRLLPAGLDFVFEAPCATWRETMSLRQRTDVPIVLDELADSSASVIDAVADDAADGIGLKISKNGGLTQCRRQRDIAIAAGLTMSVQDTVGSDVSFAAVLHMAQTVPARNLRCVLDVRGMVSLTTASTGVELVDGGVTATDAPGLGIDVDLAVMGEPIASWS